MTFISLPKVGSLTLDINNLLSSKAFMRKASGTALNHSLYSHISRKARRKGKTSKRQVRKLMNRQRRWFVDNIILHHKRIHDKNRANVVSNARSRALEKKKSQARGRQNLPRKKNPDIDDTFKWRNSVSLKDKGQEIRGRVDAKKLRARSKWMSIIEDKR